MILKETGRKLSAIVGLVLLSAAAARSQTYSYINYGAEHNIPNGFVYTIAQTNDGFLWVGTAAGISRFDGFLFYPVQYPDSSANRYPTTSVTDKQGSVWFGNSDGTVFHSTGKTISTVDLKNSRSISEIIEGTDGLIYVFPQGKTIFSVNPQKTGEIKSYSLNIDPVVYSSAFTSSGKLLLGTEMDLRVCSLKEDTVIVEKIIDGFDSNGVTSIVSTGADNDFILGTDNNGLYHLKITSGAYELQRYQNGEKYNNIKVHSILRDKAGKIWVSTSGAGSIQIDFSDDKNQITGERHYDLLSGLPGNDVKTVFRDVEGNYWFGLYGEGISMLSSFALSYFIPGTGSSENNIIYINRSGVNYILGTPEGFHVFDHSTGKSVSYTKLKSLVGNAEIKSYLLDKDKNLWIGTGGKGLYVRNNGGSVRKVYSSGDSGGDDIKDIQRGGGKIWLATTNGVIVLDDAGRLIRKFDLNSGLPHNSINKIFLDKSGNAYIGTESEKQFIIKPDFEIASEKGVMTGNTRNRVLSVTQAPDGAIWSSTEGNGIFRFEGDSVMSVKSGNMVMNYCYSILADRDNKIWTGHNKSVSRTDAESGTTRVFGREFQNMGMCNPLGMYESPDNKIFIGTTEGLLVYDKSLEDKNETAPFSNINIIEINDVAYPYSESIVLPYAKYKVRIYYSGIKFSAPDKVYFSTYLENFDLEWSRMSTTREATYNLTDGRYKFQMIAVNEDGLSQETPVSFMLIIKKPFYRTWWFFLCAASLLAGTVTLIIRQREKAQKEIQDYLEKELAARTSVVMKQKGEIELQNIEITDSINYAKRIQTSILPDLNKLKDAFRDAFIFFHPRDIVSGDFYWFDKLDEDRFVVVCADSTGHGVPGAFMSMIGSTLLQDIVSRKRISRPSEIISLLDKQIFSTLNQNVELGVSNDGMDMVVCEFNLATRHVRFASAMRPVIIVLDGEPVYVKGNRSSVGGESVIEKFFDDQEYYLREGDSIYLFSDGLPDQFGGPEGKKMKIARMKKMIEQIHDMPMDTQKEILSKFYFDWKGTYDQVDDVLLMGLKV